MTQRQIFKNTLKFRLCGRLPRVEWAAWWDLTMQRWESEGLPRLDWDASLDYFGLDKLGVLAASPGAGRIANEADYEALQPSLYSDASIEALLDRARDLKPAHDRGEIILRLWLDGFFWFPRELFGIEEHMYAFYDYPELMHRIIDDLAAFHERTLARLLDVLEPDMVGYAEDMSYNNGPMLSRDCFKKFLQPAYRRVNKLLKERSIPILVDTDGDVTTMIPWLLESGIEGVYPLERQAGVDINFLRDEYPQLLMMGGYDKMVMHLGEEAIRAEFERILPVMQSGGYVPSVDHQTPPGVSLSDYEIYIRLFKEYTEKAVQQTTIKKNREVGQKS